MKKHFILAAMAVAAIFASCSNENEENLMPSEGAPVNFVIDGPVTRTTTDATSGVTSFVEGDKIAIYSDGLQNEMAGAVFTVGGGGALTGNASYSFNGLSGANFYAYYPETAKGDAASAEFTVAADQSAEGAFGASDFMTAKKNVGAATSDAISLSFAHRLTLVKVALSGITASKVEINNVQPTATWTYSTDAVATSGNATTIRMGLNGDEYWAVIPAQTVNIGTILFTITASDGKVYTYTPTVSNITFNEGKAKKFTLALDPGKQTLVSLNTNMDVTWGNDGDESGNITELPLIAPVTASTQIRTGLNKRTDLQAGEWGTVFTATSFTANADAAEGGFDINVTAPASGSWYNRTLYYRCAKDFDIAKTYTLKFKASSAKAGQLWISVTGINSDPKDIFYHLNAPALTSNNNGARVLTNTKSSPTEFTIKITPNLTAISSTTAADGDFSTTSYTDYYIGFCVSSATAITLYSIRDIVLTQD